MDIEEILDEVFGEQHEPTLVTTANEASTRCVDAFARQGTSLYEGEQYRALFGAEELGVHRISNR